MKAQRKDFEICNLLSLSCCNFLRRSSSRRSDFNMYGTNWKGPDSGRLLATTRNGSFEEIDLIRKADG